MKPTKADKWDEKCKQAAAAATTAYVKGLADGTALVKKSLTQKTSQKEFQMSCDILIEKFKTKAYEQFKATK
jgi:hypothetical protein